MTRIIKTTPEAQATTSNQDYALPNHLVIGVEFTPTGSPVGEHRPALPRVRLNIPASMEASVSSDAARQDFLNRRRQHDHVNGFFRFSSTDTQTSILHDIELNGLTISNSR